MKVCVICCEPVCTTPDACASKARDALRAVDEWMNRKRRYSTPTLIVYGAVKDITRALGNNGRDDGGGDKTQI